MEGKLFRKEESLKLLKINKINKAHKFISKLQLLYFERKRYQKSKTINEKT